MYLNGYKYKNLPDNISYYEEIIRGYVEKGNNLSIKYTIDNIKNIIIDNSENSDEDIVLFCEKLYELAKDLYINSFLEGANIIIQKIKSMLEDIDLNEYLKVRNEFEFYGKVCEFYGKIKCIIQLRNEYEKMEQDIDINQCIKLIVKYSFLSKECENKDENKFKLNESIDNLHKNIELSPNKVMKNLKLFKNRYKKLFKYEENVYSGFLNYAKELNDFDTQYKCFKNDGNNEIISKIIEAILDDSLNNNERMIKINSCINKIKSSDYEKKETIYKLIININSKYPKVYKLYKVGFDKLVEDLKPSKYKHFMHNLANFMTRLKKIKYI